MYFKCAIAGLKTLLLIFVLILVAEIVAIATVGFGIVLDSAGSWLVFALAVFGAGFVWKLRRLRSRRVRLEHLKDEVTVLITIVTMLTSYFHAYSIVPRTRKEP